MSALTVTTKRLRAVLRADADAAVGLGHAVRCSALFAALGSKFDLVVAGDDVVALRASLPTARVRSVKREGFDVILRSERPELVVVDLPSHTSAVWRDAWRFSRLVVAVDDQGGAVDADIVVNGAAPESLHGYPALRPGSVALAGPQYVLLRSPFRNVRWRDPELAAVTIVAGSGARAREWVFALAGDVLNRSAWGAVRMVVGRTFPGLDELQEACRRARIRLLSGLGDQVMAEHLADSRAALITGGMIMSETLAVGVPAIVFPQVESMIPETRWFAERGAICDLGFDGGMEMGRVQSGVNRLLSDRDAARKQSARGREFVDGLGAERAADVIASRLASQ